MMIQFGRVICISARLRTMERVTLFLISLFLLSLGGTNGSPQERKLLKKLLEDYDTLERPTLGPHDVVNVSIGLSLLSIINLDVRASSLESNFWLSLEWRDINLQWDPKEYGNITNLRIPPSRIWKPDVYAYNSQHEDFDPSYETMVVLKSNGTGTYIPPAIHKTTCMADLTYYPYDHQRCSIKLGSWVYSGDQVDLHLQSDDGADISSYVANSEWELIGAAGVRDAIYYTCCPEPYVSVTFTIHLQRKGYIILLNYKIINAFICLMTLLSFIMPAASGQKLVIGIVAVATNLMATSSINSELPMHHNSILVFYFAQLSGLVFSSILANMLTVYFHYRTCPMPEAIRRLLDRISGSRLGLICPTRNHETADCSNEDFHNPSYVGTNEDSQHLISEINSLKRRISLQTKVQQYLSEWNYLSILLDRCFIVIYSFCIFIFFVVLFPSF